MPGLYQQPPGVSGWRGSPSYTGPSVLNPSGYTPSGSYGYSNNGSPNPTPTDLSRIGSIGGVYRPPSYTQNQSFAGGGSTGTASPNVSVITRVRNPNLDAMQGGAAAGVSGTYNANMNDVGRYSSQIANNAATNAGFAGQENSAIGDIYSGKALGDMTNYGSAYAKNMGALISGTGTALDQSRNAYGASEGAAIGKEQTDRAGLEKGYSDTAHSTLQDAIDTLAKNRSDYATASQQATNFSIADADKQRKSAQVAQGGYGGEGYFQRQSVDVRNRAQTALQQDLANRQRQDFGLTHGEQVQLNADLADRARADYGLTRQESAALASNLQGQQRGDIGFSYGQNAGVNQAVLNNNMGAYQFAANDQARLAGVRSRIGNDNANYLLGPMSARNAATGANLQDLGALGQIDRGNRFYGLDNGGAATSSYGGGGGRGGPTPNFNVPPDALQPGQPGNGNPYTAPSSVVTNPNGWNPQNGPLPQGWNPNWTYVNGVPYMTDGGVPVAPMFSNGKGFSPSGNPQMDQAITDSGE